jgi:hypothetical protein
MKALDSSVRAMFPWNAGSPPCQEVTPTQGVSAGDSNLSRVSEIMSGIFFCMLCGDHMPIGPVMKVPPTPQLCGMPNDLPGWHAYAHIAGFAHFSPQATLPLSNPTSMR